MTAQGRQPHQTGRGPTEKFLGADCAGQGPFVVLGLSPDDATDENILKALERRLEQINSHAESGTPEADEVRLAIHAAAAQLLDPAVRQHIQVRANGSSNASTTAAVSPTARLALEHDAILTLAMFGGWNKRSLRRLASLAHARGMSSAQLADALGNLAIRRNGSKRATKNPTGQVPPPAAQGLQQPSPIAAQHEPSAEEVDPAAHHMGNLLLIGGIIFVGVVIVVGLSLMLINDPKTTASPVDPGTPSATTSPEIDVASVDSLPESSSSRGTKSAVELAKNANLPAYQRAKAELEVAIEGLEFDAVEAQASFEAAISHLSGAWTLLQDDELIAIHSGLLEFLYRSAADGSGINPVQAVGEGAFLLGDESLRVVPEDIPRVVWSVGMLTRLSRENDLSASTVSLIESSLGAALGGGRPRIDPTFHSGAVAAIAQLAARLTPSQEAPAEIGKVSKIWERWAQVVEHVCRDNPQQRAQLLLVGIESLLLGELEPAQNRDISSSIAILVTKLTWREDEGSRKWLLRWFNHRGISNVDLNAVTTALATKSAAPGVDLTMVLSAAASDRSRTDMRSAYAKAWNMQSESQRQEIEAAWIREARDAVEQSLGARSPVEHMAAAAVNARLCEAGRWLWRGESSQSTVLLGKGNDDINDVLNVSRDAKAGTVLTVHSGDGQWATEYLAAGHMIPVRLELLSKKSRKNAMDPVDAEVVATEAFFGSPREVQGRAKQLVLANSENPAMINALLELVPRVPRTQNNSRLIEQMCLVSLGDVTLADWPKEARRALVQLLVEKLAAEGNLGAIDRLAAIFADSYAARSLAQPLDPDASYTPSPVAPDDAVQTIWDDRIQTAERLIPSHSSTRTLDQIRRRRIARVSTVSGAAQLFAAEQTSLVELMTYIISAQEPEHADAAALVNADMAAQRRKAKTVFEQINLTERAFLRLWLIRHGEAIS